ncbi:MAG: hypothetical protein WC901_00815 [Candidatus Margulisiibacteriota bacterium]
MKAYFTTDIELLKASITDVGTYYQYPSCCYEFKIYPASGDKLTTTIESDTHAIMILIGEVATYSEDGLVGVEQ